ncbi:MAG: Gfo/Idh/MocA family protein [Phototrophicaceae bacterium]|jgi:predicted dehydrogenase
MRVGIIGCGLIGQKRAALLGKGQLVATADIDPARALMLADRYGAIAATSWQALTERDDLDAVIIATSHDSLAEITRVAAINGKHVLVEKPAARNAAELEPVIKAVEDAGVQVRVGFNHRYHPAFQKARELVAQPQFGDLMFIRARYGHGGRIGYDKEWRADPVVSGGGELLDQGMHLIDLSRWFLGDLPHVQGYAGTLYWDMPVDDNAFMTLRTQKNQVAHLHVTWTEWKNTFSFEIYGRTGKLHIEGLGGSYGVERLYHYQMLPEMGPPDTTITEYPRGDRSWALEFEDFMQDVAQNRRPSASLYDAYAALKVVGEVYRQSGYNF